MESKTPEQLAEERYPYKPSEGGMAATAYAREIVDLKREAYAACLREGAQGIVKEGPSVEGIMDLVWDWYCDHTTPTGQWKQSDKGDLRTRLSALFTQTQKP